MDKKINGLDLLKLGVEVVAVGVAGGCAMQQVDIMDTNTQVERVLSQINVNELKMNIQADALTNQEQMMIGKSVTIRQLNGSDLKKIYDKYVLSGLDADVKTMGMERYSYLWAKWMNGKVRGNEKSEKILDFEKGIIKIQLNSLDDLTRDHFVKVCSYYMEKKKLCADYSWNDNAFSPISERLQFLISFWNDAQKRKKSEIAQRKSVEEVSNSDDDGFDDWNGENKEQKNRSDDFDFSVDVDDFAALNPELEIQEKDKGDYCNDPDDYRSVYTDHFQEVYDKSGEKIPEKCDYQYKFFVLDHPRYEQGQADILYNTYHPNTTECREKGDLIKEIIEKNAYFPKECIDAGAFREVRVGEEKAKELREKKANFNTGIGYADAENLEFVDYEAISIDERDILKVEAGYDFKNMSSDEFRKLGEAYKEKAMKAVELGNHDLAEQCKERFNFLMANREMILIRDAGSDSLSRDEAASIGLDRKVHIASLDRTNITLVLTYLDQKRLAFGRKFGKYEWSRDMLTEFLRRKKVVRQSFVNKKKESVSIDTAGMEITYSPDPDFNKDKCTEEALSYRITSAIEDCISYHARTDIVGVPFEILLKYSTEDAGAKWGDDYCRASKVSVTIDAEKRADAFDSIVRCTENKIKYDTAIPKSCGANKDNCEEGSTFLVKYKTVGKDKKGGNSSN